MSSAAIPSPTAPAASHVHYHGALNRGALINLLGTVGRGGHVLFILMVTWLWGPSLMGLYLLAQAMMEVAASAIVDAPADAALVFASRHAASAGPARRDLHRVLATTMRAALLTAIVVAVGTLLAGQFLIDRFFPAYRALVPGIYLLGCALIPRAVSQSALAATKAMLHMEHDAMLNGVFHPVALLMGAGVTYAAGGGITALLSAQLIVELILCALSLRALARYYRVAELGVALWKRSSSPPVLRFLLPQALNLTFNRYIGRLDSLLLAAFGLGTKELAYYATAALLTTNLPQIRMVFSGALGPIVARLHVDGQRGVFEETLSRVARWTTSLVIPPILVLLVFRGEVLHLVSPEGGGDSSFFVVLLIPAFTNCAYGLAGACLMFTGHTRVTLANSICVAVLGTGLMAGLIPRLGTLGAAVGTTIATSIMTGLQMVELSRLERVAIRWREVWKPHIGLLLGLLPIVLAWDPTRLSFGAKVIVAVASCGGYGVWMWLVSAAWYRERSRATTVRPRL